MTKIILPVHGECHFNLFTPFGKLKETTVEQLQTIVSGRLLKNPRNKDYSLEVTKAVLTGLLDKRDKERNKHNPIKGFNVDFVIFRLIEVLSPSQKNYILRDLALVKRFSIFCQGAITPPSNPLQSLDNDFFGMQPPQGERSTRRPLDQPHIHRIDTPDPSEQVSEEFSPMDSSGIVGYSENYHDSFKLPGQT